MVDFAAAVSISVRHPLPLFVRQLLLILITDCAIVHELVLFEVFNKLKGEIEIHKG